MVIPFSLTPEWVGGYLRGNPDLSHIGKGAARCEIAGRRLTVPVEGGASVLKHAGADPSLSGHGKWRREHLGAWAAAYGRTPFFAHLYPRIEEIYLNSEGITLGEFNRRMLALACSWIDIEAVKAQGEPFESIRGEIKEKADPSLSIFDAIFRLGKEASFLI